MNIKACGDVKLGYTRSAALSLSGSDYRVLSIVGFVD